MVLTVILADNILWAIIYVLVIRAGRRDRTYGMPLVAMWGNLSW
jgi:hypothetical protein